MPPSRPQETFVAIVLQARNSGEGHRVVDAWLQGQGRIALWARHARSSKRRFGSALTPFAEVQITAVRKEGLWQLETADLLRDRLGIRSSLDAIGRAATLCRVVQALWPAGEDAEGLFHYLSVALDHLAAGRLARAAGLYPRLAAMGGLLPNTEACGRCDTPFNGPQALAPRHDIGLWCRRCAPDATPVTAGAHAALRGGRIETYDVAHEIEVLVARWVGLFTGTKLVPWAVQALPRGPTSP